MEPKEKLMPQNMAHIAALIGDNTRAAMLNALLSGKALTATELTSCADITAQTASAHLSKLLDGELIQVRKQGRHKYFQLKDHHVAHVLEQLLVLSNQLDPKTTKTGPSDSRLRNARVCYDHLAGVLGVDLYTALIHKNWLEEHALQPSLTSRGVEVFESFGFILGQQKKSQRPICKTCLDWSERKSHLAGILGSWILEDCFNKGWARQDLDSRVVTFTPNGIKQFNKRYMT